MISNKIVSLKILVLFFLIKKVKKPSDSPFLIFPNPLHPDVGHFLNYKNSMNLKVLKFEFIHNVVSFKADIFVKRRTNMKKKSQGLEKHHFS